MPKSQYDLGYLLETLAEDRRATLSAICEKAEELGFVPTVTAMDEHARDWKCDCVKPKVKPKRALCIVRVKDGDWSAKLCLDHVEQYDSALNEASPRVKAQLCAAPKCGSHGGSCKGAVYFVVDGVRTPKCRMALTVKDLEAEDVLSVLRLLQMEATARPG